MKKYILLSIAVLLYAATTQAQTLTFKYSPGYGVYAMGDFKDMLKASVETDGIKGLKTVDNFSSNWTQSAAVGLEIKNHHFGILYSFMSTGGRNHLADYSGHITGDVNLNAHKIGEFYQYHFFNHYMDTLKIKRFSFFGQVSIGTTFSNVKLNAELALYNEVDGNYVEKEEAKFNSTLCFIEPAIGARLILNKYMSVEASAGYEFNTFISRTKYKENSDAYLMNALTGDDVKTNWSGVRFNLGLTFRLPMR